MSEVKLTPPWYTFRNKIRYTYGMSPLVTVNELVGAGSYYVLSINSRSASVAFALRQVLPLERSFGNIKVVVRVFGPNGSEISIVNKSYTPKSLAKLFCTALASNPLFIGAIPFKYDPKFPFVKSVYLVITPTVIQFFNDDISDLCSNYNEVAAKVFQEVTTLEYRPNLTVAFSTYDKKCVKKKDFYCLNDLSGIPYCFDTFADDCCTDSTNLS